MSPKSQGGLGLPRYHKTKEQQKWVAGKAKTAQFIRALWKAAAKHQRRDPNFLWLLVQCGWTNVGPKGKGRESTRHWRNNKIAAFLGVPYDSDEQLAIALSKALLGLGTIRTRRLLKMGTGITHYYTAFRPATEKFIKKNSDSIRFAFERVSSTSKQLDNKILDVANVIDKLGHFKAAGRQASAFNGMTPALACLDPQLRFPIMNRRTESLLGCIGEHADAKGVVALSSLIGRHGVNNSFELDAYAYGEKFPSLPKKRVSPAHTEFKKVGLKSETDSIANIAAKQTTITKQHNELINKLRKALLWHQIVAKEYRFDALINNWKKGRDLLIEAKTASEGPTGRTQIRHAIGQLYDYRFTHFPAADTVDLAVLLPKKPKKDVQVLLASLRIELLWFEGKNLRGTIKIL